MESSEREPSYYEVALTHRQLMVGLVVALTTVVVAFFAGVWIGRGGGAPAAKGQSAEAAAAAASAQPEQLTFFGEKGTPSRPASKPAPIAPKPAASAATATTDQPAPTPAESEAETLRKTLEAEMAANRVDGAEAAPPATTAVAPGTRVSRTSSTSKAPATAPAKASSAGKGSLKESAGAASSPPTAALWIQVYSSTNHDRATEISARLKKNGFVVKTLESPKEGATTYRVRVGPYSDRVKADRAASRLRREFKLDTWVTDAP